jgi:hypothetical protein
MPHRYLALSIALILTMPFTVVAKESAKPASLSQAQKLINEGKNLAAVTMLNEVIDSVWNKIPFQISFYTLTETASQGFGMYNARKSNIYLKDKAVILLYLEPVGYKFISEKKDLFKFGFAMDLYLLDKKNKVIFNKENFLNQELVSHLRNKEFFLTVTLTLTSLEVGDYTIKLITHDTIGKQQTQILVPITITQEAGESSK